MGEWSVRRNRGYGVPSYRAPMKTEKQENGSAVQQADRQDGLAAGDSLRQVKPREALPEGLQEVRKSLQTGEAVLAEVQESLGKLEEIAEKAAEDGADGAALQAELGEICDELGRIIEAGPFESIDSLLTALGADFSKEAYQAAVYLGAVISGAEPAGPIDPAQIAEGLRQLAEALAQGQTPDEAVKELTGGKFVSLEDFREQFSSGTAPGLQDFLTGLPSAEGSLPAVPSLLSMLMEGGGMEGLDLLMGLLTSLEVPETGQAQGPGAAYASESAPGTPPQPQAAETGAAPPPETREFGGVQVTGQDLPSAGFDPKTDVLTLAGKAEYTLRGQGQEAPAIRLTNSGVVGLQQVRSPLLAVESAQARVDFQGENSFAQIQLKEGATLTLQGGGVLHIGGLRGGEPSTLRLAGGTVEIPEDAQTAVPVVVDGPVSLLAAKSLTVRSAQGEALTPFDILWKTMLPDWSAISALAVDSKQGPLNRARDAQPEAVRLWLLKGDPSHGYPAHTVVLQGRDQAGRLQTRYVYLRWSLQTGSFEALPLYPNPFTVTGGQQDVDWRYEEESHTLHILTSQVTAIAGGTGEDANQLPFSGRVALADGIGQVELILEGVECRVSSGRAFSLGRGNKVTLLLQGGSHNVFESGAGCAGISLGEGTSLRIDQAQGTKGKPGTLAATGGSGSAGIGRDSGVGQQLSGPILIRGGSVTSTSGKAPAQPPKPHMAAPSLRLDALDISTREAAQAAVQTLAKGRRQIAQMQKAYSTLYGRLEQRMGRLRDSGEADALLWDMRQSLEKSSVAEYSQWLADGIGHLLW